MSRTAVDTGCSARRAGNKTPGASAAAETNPGQLHVHLIKEVHTPGSCKEGSFFPVFPALASPPAATPESCAAPDSGSGTVVTGRFGHFSRVGLSIFSHTDCFWEESGVKFSSSLQGFGQHPATLSRPLEVSGWPF